MLNKNILIQEIQKANKIAIGCDYLRLNLNQIYEIDKRIDLDNSNFCIISIGDLEITKIKLGLHLGLAEIYATVYKGVVVPLCCIVDYSYENKQKLKAYGKIDFYGSFFRLQEIGPIKNNDFINDFLLKIGIKKPISMNITRLDIKIDFMNIKENKINLDLFKINKKTKIQKYECGNDIESAGIGSKLLKRQYLRIYDKAKDILIKNKHILYQDYFKYLSIIRVETEFLNKCFKKNDTLENLYKNIDRCTNIMLGNINIDYQDKVYIFENYNSIQYNTFVKKRVKQGAKIAKLGVNPYLELYKYMDENFDKKRNNELIKEFEIYNLNINNAEIY